MFPIPWNFPFRKKNGDLSTISDVINSGGGGGSDLPPHDIGDAGKLLSIDSAGKLEWTDDVSSEIQTLTNLIGETTVKTLVSNATSIEFDVPATGNNLIEFFSSDGSNYTAIDTSVSGKVTLTYDAVASARTISCRIATIE